MKDTLSVEEIDKRIQYLRRGVEDLIEPQELEWKIDKAHKEERSLGVDPTAPDIHLGHTVPLMKLKHFQDLGYDVDFLIGDFTARIGDPSGRSAARKPMTHEDVLGNADEYKRQIFKILNPDQTNIVYNSDWLSPIKLDDFIKILGKGTINEMVKRRGVANRLEEGNPVSVAEFVYPFLQAYDSVAMKADVEIGGADQFFNFVFTREMQRAYGQEPQVIMTLPLLVGLDGKEKMSKTYDNHVALEDPANEMYGKIMSISDEQIISYFDLLTNVPYEEVSEMQRGLIKGEQHPRDLKAKLAREITTQYHDKSAALEAENNFDRIFKYRQEPENIETFYLSNKESRDIGSLLVEMDLAPSKSQVKRLIKQGGVRVDGEKIDDPHYNINPEEGMVINVGKRNFKKIGYEKK